MAKDVQALVDEWHERAELLRYYGSDATAKVLDACAIELVLALAGKTVNAERRKEAMIKKATDNLCYAVPIIGNRSYNRASE